MRAIALAALPSLMLIAAAPPAKLQTPTDIANAAPRADWKEIPADDLLQLELKDGRKVIIQLAPAFAPVHVANIRALAKGGWWDGAAIYRVQENYVVQWGHNDGVGKLPDGVVAKPPAEYARKLAGLKIVPLGSPDSYAPKAGFADGWPIAYDPKAGTANLTHCYSTVGVGRDLSPDTGTGGELYAIIGQATRQLDRNVAQVGRVVLGFDAMTTLPRAPGPLGIYQDRSSDVPIKSIRLMSDLPASERTRFEYLTGPSFAAYLKKRANRRDDFYIRPAGGVDVCNVNVPVRIVPKG